MAAPTTSSNTIRPGERPRSVGLDGAGADGDDEHDDRGVVETGLDLQRAGDRLAQRHGAEHGEHRGRVRGRQHGREQHGELPPQVEQVVRADRDDDDADDRAERGQHQPEAEGRTHVVPRRREPALGEDQHQGREAERQGEVGVGEVDAGAGAAEQEPETEVGEQRGQAGGDGQPHGEDRRDEDGGPDQEKMVELVDVHASSSTSAGT